MQVSNPTLQDKAFNVSARSGEGEMTQSGTYQKTAILLAICIGGASFSFSPGGMIFLWPGIIGGLILAVVTSFKKEYAMYTGPLYALSQGLVLGAISYAYNVQYAGIVLNAVMLTMAVFALMLFLYTSKIIQLTDRMRVGIGVATGAIFLVYMVSMLMSFFGSSIPMIHGAGPVGIGFSLIVVGIAAFNLLISFDFIERASNRRNVPKYMEWYGAFGLIVTLVWLYLEILRLLSKLNRR